MEITDFTKDYSILFKGRLNPTTFSIDGYKLGDSTSLIDYSMVQNTYNHKFPKGVTPWTYKEGGVYYLTENNEIVEYLLEDRIESVINTNGQLNMKNGYSIRIENKIIVEFVIEEILPVEITDIPESKIEEKFGKATKITKDYIDGVSKNSEYFIIEFYYLETKLSIVYVNWLKKIEFIKIGKSIKK